MRDVIYHDRPRVSTARKAIRVTAVLVACAVILLLGVILFTRMDLDMNRQAVESLRNREPILPIFIIWNRITGSAMMAQSMLCRWMPERRMNFRLYRSR